MAWVIRYTDEASRQFDKLDKGIQRTIMKYMGEVALLVDPSVRGHGLTGPWAGYHRYRIGQLRVIVSFERQEVTIAVVEIGKRDSIY